MIDDTARTALLVLDMQNDGLAHAADAGYDVVVVSDGTATFGEEWQRAALDFALSRIVQRATTAQLLENLRRLR